MGRQKALSVSHAGYIFVGPGAEWGTPDAPEFSTVEVTNLEVLEFIDSEPSLKDESS